MANRLSEKLSNINIIIFLLKITSAIENWFIVIFNIVIIIIDVFFIAKHILSYNLNFAPF